MTTVDHTYHTRLVLLKHTNTDDYINIRTHTFEKKKSYFLRWILPDLIIISVMFISMLLICGCWFNYETRIYNNCINQVFRWKNTHTSGKAHWLNWITTGDIHTHTHTLMEYVAEKIHVAWRFVTALFLKCYIVYAVRFIISLISTNKCTRSLTYIKCIWNPFHMFQQMSCHPQGVFSRELQELLHPRIEYGYTLKILKNHTYVMVMIHRCTNVQDFKLKTIKHYTSGASSSYK
jgi:hypothetical protein